MGTTITREIYFGQGHLAGCVSLTRAVASGIGLSSVLQRMASPSSTMVQAGVQLLRNEDHPTHLEHYFFQDSIPCQEWNTDTLEWEQCPFFGTQSWFRVGIAGVYYDVQRDYIFKTVNAPPYPTGGPQKIPIWLPPAPPPGAPPDWKPPDPPIVKVLVYGELGLLGKISPYLALGDKHTPSSRVCFYPYPGQYSFPLNVEEIWLTFSGMSIESSYGNLPGEWIRTIADTFDPPTVPEEDKHVLVYEQDEAWMSAGYPSAIHEIYVVAESRDRDVGPNERMKIIHKEWGAPIMTTAVGSINCPVIISTLATKFTDGLLNVLPDETGTAYINQYELFSAIPFPAPYSIRNLIDTPIIIKLSDSAFPINRDAIRLKINDVDVTNQLQMTDIPNGVELQYDILPNTYMYGSRVYVELFMTQTPAIELTVDRIAPEESVWLRVAGDTRLVMPGVDIKIGPNDAGEWEVTHLWEVANTYEFRVDPTTYEYLVGDPVYYLSTDYSFRLYYWFDIMDDFVDPSIYNIVPTNGSNGIEPATSISFDVQDVGMGLDFSTLMFLVNGMFVTPEIKQHVDGFYRVTYTPPYPFKYNTTVFCMATITDLSAIKNRALEVWSFRIRPSEALSILTVEPNKCGYNVHLKDHIMLSILSGEAGIDLNSLILTVDEISYPFVAWPILYRLK